MAIYNYEYKCIIKVSKDSCHKAFNSFTSIIAKTILDEYTENGLCTLRFKGLCKDKYSLKLSDKSNALGVEILCNYGIIREFDLDDWYVGSGGTFKHYDKNGNEVKDDCPESLYIRPYYTKE